MAQASDTVWLPVLPSFKDFGPALIKGAGSDADKAGGSVGKRFGMAIAAGVAGAVAGVSAAGAALYKVGEVFDDVADTIRVGTGATGAALDGLIDSAKNVGKSVPADFEKVGTVVADINTRLGLSGTTLETVASQYLEAGRILGEEVDVTKTSAAFSAFKIEGEGVIGAMDHLFQVSQATGVGMNELADAAARNAPAMDILGFSFEETTAMIGSFDKAGLNSSALMASMSKGMVTLAKDGEEPAAAFRRVQEEINGFVSAGDDAAALELASKVFGTKGAAQFIGAIKSGALNLEDMSKAAGQTGDSILGVGEETMDFAEQWQLFKNNVLVWLEPMGARVFGALGTLMGEVTDGVTAFGNAWKYNDGEVTSSGIPGVMERLGFYARQAFDYFQANVMPVLRDFGSYITGTVVPALSSFGGWLKDNAYILGVVAAAVVTYVAVTKTMAVVSTITTAVKGMTLAQLSLNAAFKANPIGLIVTALALLAAGVMYAYNNVGWFKDAVDAAFRGIQSVVAVVVDWFQTTLLPILSSVWTAIADGAMWLWNNGIRPAWDGIMAAVSAVATWFQTTLLPAITTVFNAVGAVFSWLYANVVKPVFDLIVWYIGVWWTIASGIFQVAVAFIRNVLAPIFTWLWASVIQPVFGFIGALIGAWWNGIVKPIFDGLVWFFQNILGPIFMWLWNNIVAPVFNGIRDVITNVWNNGIKPVFDRLAEVVRALPSAFEAAKDGIGKAWDKVQEIAKKPVRFVIDRVINDGLIGTFNKIPGVDIKKVSLPPGFKNGGYTGDGPADEIAGPAHRGEFYFTKKQTAAIGKEKLYAMARNAGRGAAASAGEGNMGDFFHGSTAAIRRAGAYFLNVPASMAAWNFAGAARMWDGAAGVRVGVGRGQAQGYASSRERGGGILGYTVGNNIDMSPSWMRQLGATQRRTVAAHEMGHALGLPHNSRNSIMQPNLANMASAPTAVDIRNLQSLYPGGSGKAGSPAAENPFNGLVTKLMDQFKQRFPEGGMVVDSIGGLVKGAIEKVTKWIQDIKDGVKNVAGDVVDKVRGFFGGAATVGQDNPMAYLHDQGGVLQPGLSAILNKTGKPEAILNAQQWGDISKLALSDRNPTREIVIQGNVGWDPAEVARQIETQERRARVIEGVFV